MLRIDCTWFLALKVSSCVPWKRAPFKGIGETPDWKCFLWNGDKNGQLHRLTRWPHNPDHSYVIDRGLLFQPGFPQSVMPSYALQRCSFCGTLQLVDIKPLHLCQIWPLHHCWVNKAWRVLTFWLFYLFELCLIHQVDNKTGWTKILIMRKENSHFWPLKTYEE